MYDKSIRSNPLNPDYYKNKGSIILLWFRNFYLYFIEIQGSHSNVWGGIKIESIEFKLF